MFRRIKSGDVFSIETPLGIAYVQNVKVDKLMGHLIRILQGTYKETPNFVDLVAEEERFNVYFPLSAALNKKLIAFEKNEKLPVDFSAHMKLKAVPWDKENESWYIYENGYDPDDAKRVEHLSDKQKKYSSASTVNLKALVDMIVGEWPIDYDKYPLKKSK